MRTRSFRLAILLALTASQANSQEISGDLSSLFETERAFSKTSVEKGARPAFIEFFADDGIAFRPHPVIFKQWASKNPLPQVAPRPTLVWEPIYGETSAAGDLGWDTGPSSFVDNSPEKKPTQYGFFFTVWRRQPDKSWKVALDHGIQVSDASSYFGMTPGTSTIPKGRPSNSDSKQEQKALLQLDRTSVRSGALAASYERILSDDARMYRDMVMPLIGKDSILAHLRSLKTALITIDPIFSDVSLSGDLGYTYGNYTLRDSGSARVDERGYYIRVWKLESGSHWKVVFDITAPLPKDAK